MTSIDDIMPRLKNLEVELDKSILKNAELLKLTAEHSSQIDELKKKFDGKSTDQSTDGDFTTKTWFWTSDVVRSTLFNILKKNVNIRFGEHVHCYHLVAIKLYFLLIVVWYNTNLFL